MVDLVFRGIFQGLVRQVGGVEAAAAIIGARACGAGHKGTVSKMCSGSIGVTVEAAAALEEAAGCYPVTEYLTARRGDGIAAGGSFSDLAAQTALAAGVTHSALVRAMGPASAGGITITAAEAAGIIASASTLADAVGAIVRQAETLIPKGGA